MIIYTIQSVKDAIDLIDEKNKILDDLTFEHASAYHGEIWFRGQQDESWDLSPSVFRRDSSGNLKYNETGLYTDFKLRQPEYRHIYKSPFDWLCLMQHYGLPTRLLDWTESILVALYFAVNDTEKTKDMNGCLHILGAKRLNSISSIKKYSEIWIPEASPILLRAETVIYSDLDEIIETVKYKYDIGQSLYETIKRTDKDKFKLYLTYPIAVFPYHLNSRMIFQESVLVLFGGRYVVRKTNNAIDAPVLLETLNNIQPHNKKFLKSFKIPKQYKERIKYELFKLGIHEGTLFPELEHQANCIREKWKY